MRDRMNKKTLQSATPIENIKEYNIFNIYHYGADKKVALQLTI